jgi:hypothetical protein
MQKNHRWKGALKNTKDKYVSALERVFDATWNGMIMNDEEERGGMKKFSNFFHFTLFHSLFTIISLALQLYNILQYHQFVPKPIKNNDPYPT